jgi:hypothetical protein
MLKKEDIKEIFISGGVNPIELPEVEFIQPSELKEIAKQLEIANKLKLAELGIDNNIFMTKQFEILTKINEELHSDKVNCTVCNKLVDKDNMSTISDTNKNITFVICNECNEKYNFRVNVYLK